MQETLTHLEDMGFPVPEVTYYRVAKENGVYRLDKDVKHFSKRNASSIRFPDLDQHAPVFYITPNLRKPGHELVEYTQETAESLENGESLVQEANGYCDSLNALESYGGLPSQSLRVYWEVHDDGKDGNFEKMFFLRTKDNIGKLVLGDFDHVHVYFY